MRILEAVLFAADEPLDEKALADGCLRASTCMRCSLQLQEDYAPRGVNLVRVGGKWSLRTAGDLAWILTRETVVTKKLSRAAIETLAIVAYHSRSRAPRSRRSAGSAPRKARSTCCWRRLGPPARPPQGAGAACHLRNHRNFHVAFRP